MASPSQKCTTQIANEGHQIDLVGAANWIMVREYRRVKGSEADVQAWDVLFKKAWDALEAKDPSAEAMLDSALDDAAKTFISNVRGLTTGPALTPGWDDKNCLMDWGEYACFCNWAAKQPPGQLVSFANAVAPGQKLPYSCDPAIQNDPAYAGDYPSPSTGSSKWAWVAAGAAVLALGGVGYAVLGRRKANPTKLDPAARAKLEKKKQHLEGSNWPSELGPRPILYPPNNRKNKVNPSLPACKYPYKAVATGMSDKWRSYTQVFENLSGAEAFLEEMVRKHAATRGELWDRKHNKHIATLTIKKGELIWLWASKLAGR